METCQCQVLDKSGRIVDGIIQKYIGKCRACKSAICTNCSDTRLCRKCTDVARETLRPEVLQDMAEDQLFESLKVFGIVLVGNKINRNMLIRLVHTASKDYAANKNTKQWTGYISENNLTDSEDEPMAEQKPEVDKSTESIKYRTSESEREQSIKLSEIRCKEEIPKLTIRQLKQILLDENCLDESILDKDNLVQLVNELWSKITPSFESHNTPEINGGKTAESADDGIIRFSPLFSNITSETDISKLRSAQLKTILRDCSVDANDILERQDFEKLVTDLFLTWKHSSVDFIGSQARSDMSVNGEPEVKPEREAVVHETDTCSSVKDEVTDNVTSEGVRFSPHFLSIASESNIYFMRAPQLKEILSDCSVNQMEFLEKNDLANKVTELYLDWKLLGNPTSTATAHESQRRGHRMTEGGATVGSGRQKSSSEQIKTVSGIEGMDVIEDLSEEELRMILRRRGVECDDDASKWTLAYRVLQLWHTEREKGQQGDDEDYTCCICMEKEVDSTFLECGHAATCMSCALPLKLCPICRESIVRVVRIFRS